MEEKTNGERKKLSLSLDGKLTLKNPITSSKSISSVTTNSRIGRSTVQVEVKRTKKQVNRTTSNTSFINKTNIEINFIIFI